LNVKIIFCLLAPPKRGQVVIVVNLLDRDKCRDRTSSAYVRLEGRHHRTVCSVPNASQS